MNSNKEKYMLWGIFALALVVRMLWFGQNTYFGFDEARDAFISRSIYLDGELKMIGPPANAPGLNHGVLHWYLIGPLYLLGNGSPYLVSFLFRLINALAIFPIFWISKKLFGQTTGIFSILVYAISFEASQYAMYYGNPSLAIFSWISIFAGITIILKNKNIFWGLPLMALGIATGAQLELFLVTLIFVGLTLLLIAQKKLGAVSLKSWMVAVAIFVFVTSPYIVGEIKNNFRSIRSAIQLTAGGYNVAGGNETKLSVYSKRWLIMLHDNAFAVDKKVLVYLSLALIAFWLYMAMRKNEYRVLLVWIFGGAFIFMFGAYNAYYINVGIGTGVIIGVATLLDKLFLKNKLLGILVLFFVITSNSKLIFANNKHGLIEDIKTQQYMLLGDEIKVINKLYEWAEKRSFTIRVTSMPYRMQTVWAYLFDQYGFKKYGYLPYYETGNVLGYPGYLPEPKNGTSCVRFLIREPLGGIPPHLVEKDTKDEDAFSTIVETTEIGKFTLEKRVSKDEVCFQDNYPN